MRTVSIERTKLKEYAPTFTTASIINNETKNIEDAPIEKNDDNLMPIVKLLHAVFVGWPLLDEETERPRTEEGAWGEDDVA